MDLPQNTYISNIFMAVMEQFGSDVNFNDIMV